MVTNLYPPDIAGGYEVGLSRTVGALRAAGLAVTVLTAKSERNRTAAPAMNGDEHVERRLRHLPPGIAGLKCSPDAGAFNARTLMESAERIRPDIVWFWNPALLGGEVFSRARELGLRIAICISDLRTAFLPEIPRDIPTAFVSEALRDAALPFGYRRDLSAILPHWLDPQENPSPLEGRDVIAVGGIIEEKGVFDLAEAAALARNRFRPVFIGAGAAAALESRLLALGITDFLITGPVNPEALAPWYRSSAVAVSASRLFEAQSVAVLEALSWGLPTIATPLGGNIGYFRPEPLCLEVPPGAPEAIAEKLDLLFDDIESRREWGRKGHDGLERRFSRAVVIPRIIRWLKEISS